MVQLAHEAEVDLDLCGMTVLYGRHLQRTLAFDEKTVTGKVKNP